jgi:hypothetical protein
LLSLLPVTPPPPPFCSPPLQVLLSSLLLALLSPPLLLLLLDLRPSVFRFFASVASFYRREKRRKGGSIFLENRCGVGSGFLVYWVRLMKHRSKKKRKGKNFPRGGT